MSAEIRTRAASLVRSRALAAIHQPHTRANDPRRTTWEAVCASNNHDPCRPAVHDSDPRMPLIHIVPVCDRPGDVADHIALWDPMMAGLVADLIECPCDEHAQRVSRALLRGALDHK